MNKTILDRQLTEMYQTTGKQIPGEAVPYIRKAMVSFAVKAIQEERQRKRKQMVEVLKHLPKFFFIGYWYFIKLWIRKRTYKIAVKQAQFRANTENYKVYVVQETEYSYRTISTLDFKYNKKIKVFKHNLTAKDLEAKASLVVYPKKL